MKYFGHITWIVVGFALAGSVLAFAPISGELDPPAGPVADTTPSLEDISLQIAGLDASLGSPFPPDLRVAHDSFAGNQSNEMVVFVSQAEAEFVRIYAVVMTGAVSNMLVGDPEQLIMIAGGTAVRSDGSIIGTSHIALGGLRVPTPVKFHTSGSNTGSNITLLYWVE